MRKQEILRQLLEKNSSILRFNPSLYKSTSSTVEMELAIIELTLDDVDDFTDNELDMEIKISQQILDDLLTEQKKS